jgi:hypothetical protein
MNPERRKKQRLLAGIPRSLSAISRVYRIVLLILLLSYLSLRYYYIDSRSLGPIPFVLNMAIAFGIISLAYQMPNFVIWYFNRKLEEWDYQICTDCGYPLKGLPAVHRCPECGAEYNVGKLETYWKQELARTRRSMKR